jgi:hypothetical protein
MYQEQELTNNKIESPLTNAELVFTQQTNEETGEHVFIGGGYKVNSYFLQQGLSPMTTYNINNNNNVDQKGGKLENERKGEKVSSPYENLAVPAGLFYINQKMAKPLKMDINENDYENDYKEHKMLPDDIFDKLFNLVEYDKKQKRKTRKNLQNIKKRKSRKQ